MTRTFGLLLSRLSILASCLLGGTGVALYATRAGFGSLAPAGYCLLGSIFCLLLSLVWFAVLLHRNAGMPFRTFLARFDENADRYCTVVLTLPPFFRA